MSGYQFIHIEGYARSGTAKKRSLLAIAEEADRVEGNYPHVAAPQVPEFLLGHSFVDAAQQIIEAANASSTQHSGKARQIRKDANVGLGLVASHPLKLESLTALPADEQAEAMAEIRDWAEAVIAFAESEFPGQVQAAALHWDEANPHIHILIGSTESTEDFQTIHNGDRARQVAQGNDRSKQGKKVGSDAYTQEMRRFQDRYHREVAMQYGQTRLGPKRRRLTRSEWQQEQAQAEALKNTQRQAAVIAEEMERKRVEAVIDVETLTEAAREEIARQQRAAEKAQKAAEHVLQQAKREREAAERKQAEADAALAEAKALLANSRKYDGPVGSLLGALGVKDRLAQKAQSEADAQIQAMQAEIDRLKHTARQASALMKERDSARKALFELMRALCWPERDLPPDGTHSPRNGHLHRILEIVAKHKEATALHAALETYLEQLRLHQLTVQTRDPIGPDLMPNRSH